MVGSNLQEPVVESQVVSDVVSTGMLKVSGVSTVTTQVPLARTRGTICSVVPTFSTTTVWPVVSPWATDVITVGVACESPVKCRGWASMSTPK